METSWCSNIEDINWINRCLKHSLPPGFELSKMVNSGNPEVKLIASSYSKLLNDSLIGFLNLKYQENNITNLMVISARGYLPILESRQKELTEDIMNLQDSNGLTALHYAIDDPSIVSFLINHGSDIYLKNNSNESPYDLIKKKSNIDIEYEYILQQIDESINSFSDKLPSSVTEKNDDIRDRMIKSMYPPVELHTQNLRSFFKFLVDNSLNDEITFYLNKLSRYNDSFDNLIDVYIEKSSIPNFREITIELIRKIYKIMINNFNIEWRKTLGSTADLFYKEITIDMKFILGTLLKVYNNISSKIGIDKNLANFIYNTLKRHYENKYLQNSHIFRDAKNTFTTIKELNFIFVDSISEELEKTLLVSHPVREILDRYMIIFEIFQRDYITVIMNIAVSRMI